MLRLQKRMCDVGIEAERGRQQQQGHEPGESSAGRKRDSQERVVKRGGLPVSCVVFEKLSVKRADKRERGMHGAGSEAIYAVCDQSAVSRSTIGRATAS